MIQKNRIFLSVACIALLLLLSGVTTSTCNRYPLGDCIVDENPVAYIGIDDRVETNSLVENSGAFIIDSGVRHSKLFTLSATPHDPILIVNDTDFADQAADEGWSGDGSAETPYTIENYLINGSAADGIKIADTTVYFAIYSCELVNSSWSGICLDNVTHGEVNSSLCLDNTDYGISIYQSNYTLITDNTIQNNQDGGIDIGKAYTSDPFFLEISHNIITDNNDCGIEGILHNSVIAYNDISNHTYGIYLNSDSSEINDNNITMSFDAGIQLMYFQNTILDHNRFSDTDGFGICLFQSVNNTITNNILWDCGFGYRSPTDALEYCKQTLVENNLINGKALIFLQDEVDVVIDSSPTVGQIVLLNCSEVHIKQQEMVNCTVGLYLTHCNNVTLEEVTSTNHRACGMFITDGSNVTIKNCDISRNKGYTGMETFYSYGASLYLNDLSNVTILSSIISENGILGVYGDNIDYITVDSCTLNDNYYIGLDLTGFVDYCTINGNTACGNGFDGIKTYGHNYTISSNNVSYNSQHGISSLGQFYLIENNTASFNSESGIFFGTRTGLASPVTYSTIIDNLLQNNTIGIILCASYNVVCNNTIQAQWADDSYCVEIAHSGFSPTFYPAVNNTVTWNDFISFRSSWVDDCSFHGIGINTTIEYNYYSTYDGTDSNQDGIGDSIFYAGPNDPYPVMLPRGSDPIFLQEPSNQISNTGIVSYDVNATARPPGVHHWWINDTTHFSISTYGFITNASSITPGSYGLEIRVYDYEGRFTSAVISIVISEPSTPTTTNTLEPFPPEIMMLVIVLAGAAVAVVLVIYYLRRRKPS